MRFINKLESSFWDQEMYVFIMFKKLTRALFLIAIILSSKTFAKESILISGERKIKVYGITSENLQKLEYISIDKEKPQDINRRLVKKLHQQGYISSEGFVISSDEIFLNQGVITIVNVFGLTGKVESAVKNIAKKLVGKRPNVTKLDETLTHINSLSGVDATFALESSKNKIMDPRGWSPKDNTTHYTLIVKATEQSKYSGAVTLDSMPQKILARNRATVTQTINSVLVGGDHVQGSFTHIWGDKKENQNEGAATYFLPLMTNGLYAEIHGSYTASKNEIRPNVKRDFKGTNVTGTLGYPILRAHNETLTVLGGIGNQGEDQEGGTNGKTEAIYSTLFYNHSDPEGNSFTSGVTLTSGSASSQGSANENGDFKHIRIGMGYIHALNFIADDTELRVEAFGQWADKTVPSSQKFLLGGTEFLRGYPVGEFSGNNGRIGTAEIGHKFLFENSLLSGVNVKLFFDTGNVSSKQVDATSNNRPKNMTISSIGIGSSGEFSNGFNLSGWLASALNKDNQGKELDPALYLKLTKGW